MLLDFFRPKPCAICAEKETQLARANAQWDTHVRHLQDEIQSLKQERDLLQQKLFQAVRLTDRVPKEESHQPRDVKRTTSARSWPRLQHELEVASASKKDGDAKENMWRRHNERVEREIPELAEKLSADTTQTEIQRDTDFLAS